MPERLIQSIIIQHKALEHKFLQDISSPNTEMSGFCRVHTIADRNDCIKIVELCFLGLRFTLNSTMLSVILPLQRYSSNAC